MTMPRYCHALLHPQASPVQYVGQKAYHLMQLARAGLSVPWGFVVGADAFAAFLARRNLGARIDAALADLDWQDLAAVAAQSQQIAAWVMAAPWPVGLWPQVRLRCRETPSAAGWAVRSSAVGEDSHAASFAGQLHSCLSVRRETALATSLRRVWASYWSARVLHYQRGRGIRLQGMAVIFQHMMQPALSGVLFTRAPEGTGSPDDMLVEYCAGVGE